MDWLYVWMATAIIGTGEPRPEPQTVPPVLLAQVLVQERVIMRVPVRPSLNRAVPMDWKEGKADKCILSKQVAGAAVTQAGAVDFILKGGARVRARFERACPALDFYSGFYLKPTSDGRICAVRDSIHARSGGECSIERFRSLKPKTKKP
jgi:hypothetical protein